MENPLVKNTPLGATNGTKQTEDPMQRRCYLNQKLVASNIATRRQEVLAIHCDDVQWLVQVANKVNEETQKLSLNAHAHTLHEHYIQACA